MELTAKIHSVGAIEEMGARGFKVRKFIGVLDWHRQYPQFVQFQVTGDNVAMLDGVAVGDVVTLQFEIEGRMYDKKDPNTKEPTGEQGNFTSLRVWDISKGSASPTARAAANAGNEDVPF